MMSDLRQTIGNNIMSLRTNAHLTQSEFAEKLNYTDKAISKWERGESVPDIAVLKTIAELFGVTVDYLLQEEHQKPKETENDQNIDQNIEKKMILNRNHMIISIMAIMIVWFCAVFSSFLGYSIFKNFLWQAYVVAIPTSTIVALVFNSVWGNTKCNYLIISILIWTSLATLYVLLLPYNLWTIFLLGIPGEIVVVLWSRLHYPRKK